MSNYNVNKFKIYDNTYYLGTRGSAGDAYGICTNFQNQTALTASLSDFSLYAGGIINILFQGTSSSTGVVANATLNINNTGAKSIYYRGAPIQANVILPQDLVMFIYDGTYFHIINIDNKLTPYGSYGYEPGDTLTFSYASFGGYLLNGRNALRWVVPLQKPILPSVTGYTVDSFSGLYVQGRGQTLISNATLSNVEATFDNTTIVGDPADWKEWGTQGILFRLNKNSGTWTSTTNLGRSNFQITFEHFQMTFI